MKTLTLSLLVVIVFLPGPARADEEITFLDLSLCEMNVGDIHEVESVQGERGKVLKASRRDAKLIEVEFLGVAHGGGNTGVYPAGFSVMCSYRRSPKIFPSIAVGVRDTLPDGKLFEYWLNEKGASMIMEYTDGEKIRFYAVFEVPKNADDFLVQYPVHVVQ